MDHEGNQSKGTRDMKNVTFVHKDVQKIISSHKISKKHNKQLGLLQRGVLKNFLRKHLCWSFLFQ